jgi:hypothetical protein
MVLGLQLGKRQEKAGNCEFLLSKKREVRNEKHIPRLVREVARADNEKCPLGVSGQIEVAAAPSLYLVFGFEERTRTTDVKSR